MLTPAALPRRLTAAIRRATWPSARRRPTSSLRPDDVPHVLGVQQPIDVLSMPQRSARWRRYACSIQQVGDVRVAQAPAAELDDKDRQFTSTAGWAAAPPRRG